MAFGATKVSRAVLLADAGPAVDADERRILLRRIEGRRELNHAVQRRLAVGRLVGEQLGLLQAELA